MSEHAADSKDSFLKMISAATGGVVINYSDRFTLSGMSGTFPPNVQQAVKSVTDTKGPETQNQIQDGANNAAAGNNGLYGTPYSLQTGATKYAPMQKKPGTKITAKNPTMQYPTSSAKIAKTALPPPKQLTTMTQSVTYSAVSRENTASPLPAGKYPAKAHCRKVAERLKDEFGNDAPTVLYLQGQQTRMQEDNDEAVPFRQRRHFIYLSGCLVPDCHLIYDIPTHLLTLFIPALDPDSVIWSGLPLSQEQAIEKYDIDDCFTNAELENHFQSLASKSEKAILAVTGRGELPFTPAGFSQTNQDALHATIDVCRVTKDAYEVALLRKANAITADAHTSALKHIPESGNETELQGQFLCTCVSQGAKNQAYGGIFGCGANAATLHYQKNDDPLREKRVILIDAAAEWQGYCADVTRTMPLHPDGFDKESAQIYVIVEQMQEACFKMLKAGVKWEDVHLLAHEIAIEGLLSIGLLKGEKAAILEARTSVAFFPHGLGHYLGLDTHDTGGNADYEDPDSMFQYLRVRGTLPENSVITVEPGVYFCRFIIEPYLQDEKHKQFIDEAVLERYWEVGGVRIEDDVLITRDGYENLTTAPKGIDDMMRVMYGE
ncbi:uncharacterized protein KY384_003145 [Bacidia gigantensis]|uniref:uncharacterized protein n=1 Tax=Bacidia gigantensis TaxID=2732470 RepID=UPI001D04CC60|nr:uncharacterized protein KY384_003145 [Bacidia gigantensis]KAG8531516.1 hypothetical protein KY384_003145 [Bacidia gigantensis]